MKLDHDYIDAADLATRYLEDRLPESERQAFAQHLASCEECKDRLSLARLWADSGAEAVDEPGTVGPPWEGSELTAQKEVAQHSAQEQVSPGEEEAHMDQQKVASEQSVEASPSPGESDSSILPVPEVPHQAPPEAQQEVTPRPRAIRQHRPVQIDEELMRRMGASESGPSAPAALEGEAAQVAEPKHPLEAEPTQPSERNIEPAWDTRATTRSVRTTNAESAAPPSQTSPAEPVPEPSSVPHAASQKIPESEAPPAADPAKGGPPPAITAAEAILDEGASPVTGLEAASSVKETGASETGVAEAKATGQDKASERVLSVAGEPAAEDKPLRIHLVTQFAPWQITFLLFGMATVILGILATVLLLIGQGQ